MYSAFVYFVSFVVQFLFSLRLGVSNSLLKIFSVTSVSSVVNWLVLVLARRRQQRIEGRIMLSGSLFGKRIRCSANFIGRLNDCG